MASELDGVDPGSGVDSDAGSGVGVAVGSDAGSGVGVGVATGSGAGVMTSANSLNSRTETVSSALPSSSKLSSNATIIHGSPEASRVSSWTLPSSLA